ncbi:MAG: hypothetical protein FJY15_04205 [Bacteroidetes bacterium]|nr:hypothetical protein [Bacteroidota bacterium]
MKKLFSIIATTLLLTALIVSCGKETQSSTQGGGICKIRTTITPPLQTGETGLGQSNFFYASTPVGIISWNGVGQTSALASIESQEFSVTKGQNVTFYITDFINFYDFVCRQVKVEFLIDNKVKKTEILLEFGFTSVNMSCKDGYMKTLNFIVP